MNRKEMQQPFVLTQQGHMNALYSTQSVQMDSTEAVSYKKGYESKSKITTIPEVEDCLYKFAGSQDHKIMQSASSSSWNHKNQQIVSDNVLLAWSDTTIAITNIETKNTVKINELDNSNKIVFCRLQDEYLITVVDQNSAK